MFIKSEISYRIVAISKILHPSPKLNKMRIWVVGYTFVGKPSDTFEDVKNLWYAK